MQLTLVEGLLLPFLYTHTCVIFNKCNKQITLNNKQFYCISINNIYCTTHTLNCFIAYLCKYHKPRTLLQILPNIVHKCIPETDAILFYPECKEQMLGQD